MKKITLLIAAAISISISSKAQINESVDANDTWNAFINVFNTDDSSANNGFGYPVDILRVDLDPQANTVTVYPNFQIWNDNDATPGSGQFDSMWNPYWFSSPGVPDKKVELNSYVQKDKGPDPQYFNQDVTFSGNINSFNLTEPGYVVKVFIKVFPSDFSSVRQYEQIITGAGTFSVTAPGAEFVGTDQFLQWGFQHYGLIGDSDQEPARAPQAFGGIEFQDPTFATSDLDISQFSIFPNPSNNVWNIKGQQIIENIQVFDVLGKQVMTVKPNDSDIELDASTLPNGLYFAKMTTDLGSGSVKLIKN